MKSIFLFFYQHKRRVLVCSILWTIMILIACLIPGDEVPDVHIPLIDKWVHFIIFGGFAFLWLCRFKQATIKTGLSIFVLTLLLGYVVELLQGSGITTGRSYDLYDVLADGIGGLLGTVLFFALRRAALGPK
jgi:VanZ family protein